MLPILSVSQFLTQINDIIAGEFIIEGEVSQYKISQGKWIFFDLKDATSCLNCFSTVFMVKQPLEDGMRVRVSGYPKIHEKSGRFSFTVQFVEAIGVGSLQRAYQLLKAKLQGEGLFGPERKRALPRFPARIGVVASGDSAAWGDFKRIVNNRWGGVELVLRHVAVQGEQAVADVVAAFREFNESAELCDVLVVIRGGGSLGDLAAFNSEEVVRAIYTSRIPVVSGVGHERDESLADLVADARASTPSNAAERVVPERREFFSELDFAQDRWTDSLGHVVQLLRQDVSQYQQLMFGSLEARLDRLRDFVRSSEVLFKNVDPQRVLQRGYSITRDQAGRIIKRANQVDKEAKIVVELAEGQLRAITQ
ncbi:MAG: exodeoxyribonuclease VII large subunit [Candidatus Magasanikbacteria bacterium]|nr:exodeoxyribonuclease VII large subunit [Candidatus Magasanikbacteria bacterium]